MDDLFSPELFQKIADNWIVFAVGFAIWYFTKPKAIQTLTVESTSTNAAVDTASTVVAPIKETQEQVGVSDLQAVLRVIGSITRTNETVDASFRYGNRLYTVKSEVLQEKGTSNG